MYIFNFYKLKDLRLPFFSVEDSHFTLPYKPYVAWTDISNNILPLPWNGHKPQEVKGKLVLRHPKDSK